MSPIVVLGGVVGVAGLLYWLWDRVEQRRELVVTQVAADTAAMGDIVPTSLHPQVDLEVCMGSGACVRACPEQVVIGLVGGQAKLVNPLGCVGHGECEAACPVTAITLVYGTKTRGIELPRINRYFETSRPGVYVIGELGGMGLIRNAISQGRQAAEHIIHGDGDPETPLRRGVADALDAIVVGAGPAGISATLALMEAGLRVVLLEAERFGGTITHYPRAKVVMTGALDIPLHGRVKRSTMSKEQLVALWATIQRRHELPVKTGELVQRLSQDAHDVWSVHSSSGVYRAANVLLALGVRGSPMKLRVPGEELAKVSYRLLEPGEFAGKDVLVVGGGNSAVETVLSLIDAGGCRSISLSYRKTQFARCRGSNRTRIDEAIAQGAVQALLPSHVQEIGSDYVELELQAGSERIANDAVIVQIGGTPPSQLLKSFGIELVTKFGEA